LNFLSETRVAAFAVILILAVSVMGLAPTAVPTSSGNLSALASPSATPTPQPQACSVALTDNSIGVANSSTSGTITMPAAALHSVTITLSSPYLLNTVQVNGATPVGWSVLSAGVIATKTVDVAGLWTLVVATPGCAPNSVAILAY
jgi:hypothetical protein